MDFKYILSLELRIFVDGLYIREINNDLKIFELNKKKDGVVND